MEEALRALLAADAAVAALVGARIYPVEIPQGADMPALVYTRISGPRDHAFSGPTGLAMARVQVDAYADPAASASAYASAKGLIRAVRQAVDGYRGASAGTEIGGIFSDDERDFREEGVSGVSRRARVSMDLICWYQE